MPRSSGIHLTEGTSISPESYSMSIRIFSADGREVDISRIVASVTIYESIYQSVLMADVDIGEGTGLMEDLNITGNEKISISIDKQMDKESEVIILQSDWYVLDIPMFGRPKPDMQAYRIRCISPFGLVSKFKRVDYSISGTPIEILKALYNNLGTDIDVRTDSSLGIMRYYPNRKTYSEVISSILNKTMTPNGTPFFVYQTLLDNAYILDSYYNMISKEKYDSYTQSYFYTSESQTESSFEEKRKRILSISSKLGFSPYNSMKYGSYITRTHTLDWSTKDYKTFDYNSFEDIPPMIDGKDSDQVWNQDFNISGLSPNNLTEVNNIYVPLNQFALIENNEFNCHQFTQYKEAVRQSIITNMEQLEHTVRLYGDARLSCGSIIDINLSKLGLSTESESINDSMLSGRYLVVSNTHVFNNDGYYMSLKIRRDSVHKRT